MKQILHNCRLIPELSGGISSQHADVHLNDGMIESIILNNDKVPSNNENLYDCQGQTLLPGLFDLHAHVSIRSGREHAPEDAMTRLIEAMDWVQAYLTHGVTTIRDCGSTLHLAIPLRDAIRKGVVTGPDIIACGYMLGPQSMYMLGRVYMTVMEIANTVDEYRIAARNQLALGADFIKLYASQSASQSQGNHMRSIMRREEIRAAVEISEMAGTYAAAHAHSLDAIRLCIEEDVHTIEHATFLNSEILDLLEKKNEKSAHQTWLVPTYAVLTEPDGTVCDDGRKRILEIMSKNIQNAYLDGIPLGFGTDLSNGNLDNFYQEFHLRNTFSGMKPIDLLLQATKYSAMIAGFEGVKGEIREGYSADLILVNGNPDIDISVMKPLPTAVWKQGLRVR